MGTCSKKKTNEVIEMKKKQEKKEYEYVDGVEVEITEIEVIPTSDNPEEVHQIRFHTNKGDITYKPKIEKIEHRKGMAIKRKIACLIDDLPEKIPKMSELIAKHAKITVSVSYTAWTTEKDGEPKVYRFLQGAAVLEKWIILDAGEPKVDRVV